MHNLKFQNIEVLKVIVKLQHIMKPHHRSDSIFEIQKAGAHYKISGSICQSFHLTYTNCRTKKFLFTLRHIKEKYLHPLKKQCHFSMRSFS